MTGILASGARWFFGLSVLPKNKIEVTDSWVLKSDYDKVVAELAATVKLSKHKVGQQYIVCAAARNTYNGAILCSPRHYDSTFHAAIELLRETDTEQAILGWKMADQGFVDQFGKFITRVEARKIAVEAGQIR